MSIQVRATHALLTHFEKLDRLVSLILELLEKVVLALTCQCLPWNHLNGNMGLVYGLFFRFIPCLEDLSLAVKQGTSREDRIRTERGKCRDGNG